MVDEYYDEEQSNVYIWKKVKVDEVTTKDTSTCSSSFRLTQLVNGNRYRVHDTTWCVQDTNKISFSDVSCKIPIKSPSNPNEVSLTLTFKVDDVSTQVNVNNENFLKQTFTIQIDDTFDIKFSVQEFKEVEYFFELSDTYKSSLQQF